MRLLSVQHDDAGQHSRASTAVHFVGDNIPEYAILSHTWGAATEEVTYQDLMNDTGRDKSGYNKILFAKNELDTIACNIFGWIHVASTKRTILNLQWLSTLCSLVSKCS